jgi:tetratricopeptide (TPR) repeat protein
MTEQSMETLRDGRGLTLSTRSAGAIDRTEAALLGLLAGHGDVHARIDEALRCDPSCIFAHCLRASSMLLGADRAHARALGPVFATIDALLARANDRERRHAEAAQAWFAGNAHAALACYAELLIDYPCDVLALQIAHALDFRLGQREMLRDRVAKVLPHWNASMPGLGYVLGLYAFGLEETGDYDRAHAMALRSLELVPSNVAAMHAVAHVLEMQGRAREGIAWLESTRPAWSTNQGFAIHVAWHLALFHIDCDNTEAALAIYDAVLRPTPTSSTAALVDASALLWRLGLRGAPLGNRWRNLAQCWRRKRLRGSRAFNLVHAVLAFAADHRPWLAGRVTALLRRDASTRSANEPGDLALAIPLCDALQAFGRGDYARALDNIRAIRATAERCGGSVAQCDLIHLTLLEAAVRSHRVRLAKELVAERTARKPQSRLNRWLSARVATLRARRPRTSPASAATVGVAVSR